MTLVMGLILVVVGIGGIAIRGLVKKSIRVATGDRVWHLMYAARAGVPPDPAAPRSLWADFAGVGNA